MNCFKPSKVLFLLIFIVPFFVSFGQEEEESQDGAGGDVGGDVGGSMRSTPLSRASKEASWLAMALTLLPSAVTKSAALIPPEQINLPSPTPVQLNEVSPGV